jgi:uncharacterized protein (TIGR02598 family)
MRPRPAISYQRSAISAPARSAKLKVESLPRSLFGADSQTLTAFQGFSLVEVTIAVAVVAIGLIAILGLIPQGVQSSRDAADRTLAATIAQDLFDAVRSQLFTNVNLSSYGTFPNQLGNAYNLQNSYLKYPLATTYFDQSGLSPSTVQDSYFRVDLTFEAQAPPPPAVTPVLSLVTATVSWPAKPGMTTFLNTNVFVTEVALY